MLLQGRSATPANYKFGFNDKPKDDEVKDASGTQYDYGFRIYDSRIGRFLSVDPLTHHYPWYTPYQFAGNNPISFIDLDGLEPEEHEHNQNPFEPEISQPKIRNTIKKHTYKKEAYTIRDDIVIVDDNENIVGTINNVEMRGTTYDKFYEKYKITDKKVEKIGNRVVLVHPAGDEKKHFNEGNMRVKGTFRLTFQTRADRDRYYDEITYDTDEKDGNIDWGNPSANRRVLQRHIYRLGDFHRNNPHETKTVTYHKGGKKTESYKQRHKLIK